MFIKGVTEYNQQGQEVMTGMVIGRATKDADHRRTGGGKDITTVSVKAYDRKDGSAAFMDVKCWGPLAILADPIRKGQSFMAAGRLAFREYNGKTCTDLNADFFMPMGGGAARPAASSFDALAGRMENAGFADISEEDGELPF